MHKDITLKGSWFFPDKQDQAQSGTFFYSREEGCYIEVIGEYEDFYTSITSSRLHEIILGLTVDGKEITLVGCLKRNHRTNINGVTVSRYDANYAFIGKHYNNKECINFNTIKASICDLEDWIGVYGLNVLNINPSERKVNMEYQLPGNIIYQGTNEKSIFFEFNCNFTQYKNTSKAEIIQTSFIGINTVSPWPFIKILNQFFRLHKFISIAYYDSPHIKNVFLEDKNDENNNSSQSQQIELLYTDNYFNENYREGMRLYKFLFTYDDIKINFPTIIKGWFELYDKSRWAINLMIELLLIRRSPLELKFTTAIQAVETFHRNVFGGQDLSEVEHEIRMKKIFENVPEQYKKWLKEKLNYSNELGLRKRLRDIYDATPIEITERIIKNPKHFINDIVTTRNYFTHYDNEMKDKIMHRNEIAKAVDKLKVLLLCSILKEIGLNKDQIIKFVVLDKVYRYDV